MKTLLIVLCAAVCVCGQALAPQTIANPSAPGSLQPNWSVTPEGRPLLSWIEPLKGGGYALRYAINGANGWSEAHTVASNRRFFRQPAEVPEVMAMSGGMWMAHWVEMPSDESEAEFVYLSTSPDGVKWTPPVMVNKDKSQVEHGLVSMVASGNGEASLLWLETPKGEDGPAYLMRSVVNASGKVLNEERLDPDVCQCCPTAVARTAKGLLVAYRGHTPQDIRDINVIRFENGKWTQPKNVHADGWHLNACPTNAAAVAARGDKVALAWFTGAQDNPRVYVIFSADGGATFGNPVVASSGHAFGYTSVALGEDGTAIVSWLQQGDGGTTQVLARTVPSTGAAGPVLKVAEGGRMALGYPRVFHEGAESWIAWGGTNIQTARLKK
jgi:hypothetical protein